MSIPFTYLIGWSAQNKFYYGVRYKKNYHPTEIWTKYFTSSNVVKKFCEEHGEPDIIEVRKTFTSKANAVIWEDTVLRRLRCVTNTKWLNAGRGGKEFLNLGGYVRSDETKKLLSLRKREYLKNRDEDTIKRDVENSRLAGIKGSSKISEKAKERFSNPEWVENIFLASLRTPEYRAKLSDAVRGENNGFYGKKHSDATKSFISENSKERWKDPELNEQRRAAMKETLSTPEARKLKSEAASAATGIRVIVRYVIKSYSKEHLTSLTIAERLSLVRSHEKSAKYPEVSDRSILNKIDDYIKT